MDEFANKMLASQTYPLLLSFKSNREAPEVDEIPFRLEIGTEREGRLRDDHGDAILESVIETYLDALGERNAAGADFAPEPGDEDVLDLFDGPIADETVTLPNGTTRRIRELTRRDIALIRRSRPSPAAGSGAPLRPARRAARRRSQASEKDFWSDLVDKFKRACQRVWDTFKKNLDKFIKKYFRFELLEVRVEVTKQPTAKVAKSIELRGLDVKVGATIKACVKIRRWRCATINVPPTHFRAQRFFFDLAVKGLKVEGTPRAGNLDLIVDVKLFGYRFRFTLGVTRALNRIIGKPTDFIDFRSMELRIDLLQRKFVPREVALFNGPTYLEARVIGTFSRI